ncbi:MAG: hypothetical protein Q9160_009129 [Pyrenula sp. 1 TL-2023]
MLGRNSTDEKPRYESLSSQETLLPRDEDATPKNDTQHSPKPRSQNIRTYITIAILSNILLASAILATLSPRFPFSQSAHSHSHDHSITWQSCGSTPQSALAANCQFDRMMGAWIPSACFISEPADAYHSGEYMWYLDINFTTPYEAAWADAGNYSDLYTDAIYHEKHCVHIGRRLAIAVQTRAPLLDARTLDFEHTEHCARTLKRALEDSERKVDPWRGVVTLATVRYERCLPLF